MGSRPSRGGVFRYTGDDSNPWTQISGGLTDIGAAADGTGLGCRCRWQRRQRRNFPLCWGGLLFGSKSPGNFERVSVGSRTNVWALNAAGSVFRYTGDDSNPICADPRHHDLILGAGADGTVWAVNSAGTVFRYSGDQGDPNHWITIPGILTGISVGVSTNVWGITSAGTVFVKTGDDVNPWIQVQRNGTLVDVTRRRRRYSLGS